MFYYTNLYRHCLSNQTFSHSPKPSFAAGLPLIPELSHYITVTASEPKIVNLNQAWAVPRKPRANSSRVFLLLVHLISDPVHYASMYTEMNKEMYIMSPWGNQKPSVYIHLLSISQGITLELITKTRIKQRWIERLSPYCIIHVQYMVKSLGTSVCLLYHKQLKQLIYLPAKKRIVFVQKHNNTLCLLVICLISEHVRPSFHCRMTSHVWNFASVLGIFFKLVLNSTSSSHNSFIDSVKQSQWLRSRNPIGQFILVYLKARTNLH